MNLRDYRYDGDGKYSHKKFDTRDTGGIKDRTTGEKMMAENLARIEALQDRLYADGREGILIIFQAMDAAGKDGAVKHVMGGVNPQGIDVFSFKVPSSEEASHDFLWRATKCLPARGKIAIFNRSYYEDVLIARVHKLYEHQNLPKRCKDGNIIERRYAQIRHFEQYLHENGIRVIKFFLNISKDEQKRRFLSRIEDKSKNWKFSEGDIKERAFWEEYQDAYELAINATAGKHAPWYVIPADKKWFARLLISEALLDLMEDINPHYPQLPATQMSQLEHYRQLLESEE